MTAQDGAQDGTTALTIENLSKSFGDKPALRGLDLSVKRGGIHALVGANGAGKSTLFRILLGLLKPDDGRVEILGRDPLLLTPEDRARIGFVGEEHTLPDWLTVAAIKQGHKDLYADWSEQTFQTVIGHFDVRATQKLKSLSRGERAGFSLALALAQNPELLILDEPTLGLDIVAKRAFLEALIDVNQGGFEGSSTVSTIIYCSHQMDEVERIAESVIIMEAGRLVLQTDLDTLTDHIKQWSITPAIRGLSHPSLLTSRVIEDQMILTSLNAPSDFEASLIERGATAVHQSPVGVEDAINAVLTPNHRRAVKSLTGPQERL